MLVEQIAKLEQPRRAAIGGHDRQVNVFDRFAGDQQPSSGPKHQGMDCSDQNDQCDRCEGTKQP